MDSDGSRNDSPNYSPPSQVSVSDDTAALPEILDILSQRRNRQILLHLFQADGPVAVDELTTHIAALDTTTSVGTSTESTEKHNRGHSKL